MTWSVLMAYAARASQLRRTLDSWRIWYPEPWAWELVLCDDTPGGDPELDAVLADYPGPLTLVRIARGGAHNPGPVMNAAAELASGDVLVLTNPENLHLGPVFTHAQATWTPGAYLVYGCRSLRPIPADVPTSAVVADPGPWHEQWYQHRQQNNRLLHFCAVIERAAFRAMGGFDPLFQHGQSYEDNDFAERVAATLRVVTCDDPLVGHQDHSRGHLVAALDYRNRDLFFGRYAHGPRRL